MLKPGIYEQLINELLRGELKSYAHQVKRALLQEDSEISQALFRYISELINDTLFSLKDKKDATLVQIQFINEIVKLVERHSPDRHSEDYMINEPLEKLLSIVYHPTSRDANVKHFPRPRTSIARTSLFTASEDEPQIVDELKNEILSSDRIDLLVSFIKFSGIRLLLDPLRVFTHRGALGHK